MKGLNRTLMTLALTTLVATAASAGRPGGHQSKMPSPASIDNISAIGVNNLQMLVSNIGSFAYDPSQHFGKTEGLYFPRGTDRTVIFAAGLWLGAKVDGETRVAIAEHTTEWTPGPMENGTYAPDEGRFHVYKIDRGDDAASNPDYANWPFQDGAPALRAADDSDSLDALGNRIPQILGDQALWAVYNDANAGRHSADPGSTDPLGVEVQQYVFAYARSAALGNSIYIKYKIINKGGNRLDDAYVSIWCDADVGDAFNDLVGCDTVLGLGFAYNEGEDDDYGVEAPTVGFDFLQGPRVPAEGETALFDGLVVDDFRNLPMTTFNNYDNGVDPQNVIETYNLMRGMGLDGEPVVNPNGDTTTFQFAGDPVTGEGWNDQDGDDRRFMMSSGPFSMAPGDTQEVVVAVIVGQGPDHLASVAALRANDEQVQSVFDLNFEIPFPPPTPDVWVQPLPGQIEIVWSTDAEGDVQESDILGQRFVMEGYNVYQGETSTGPWTRIATFDVDNDITKIYRDQFDPEIGALQRVLVQSGDNSGLSNHLTIASDRLAGGSLIDHRSYYFAVTAYSYDELNTEEFRVGANVVGHVAEDLETRMQGIEVIPRSLAVDLVDTAAHVAGESEGTVVIRTLEPESVTGGEYAVTFNDDLSWNLDNLSSGVRLLADQTNTQGDYEYALTEGLMVQVMGPPPDIKDATVSGAGASWLAGVNWGGRFFDGSLEMGAGFFGSSILDETELVPIELRFSRTNGQKAYTYARGSEPSYAYDGWGEVPFTAWDVSSDPPRQVNVCFVEQFGLASNNRSWLPPDDDPSGGREYVFILKSDYSDQPDEFYTSRNIWDDAFDFDVLYAYWPYVAEGHSNSELADGQVLSIELNKYNKSDDRFSFRTVAAGSEDDDQSSFSLDDVHPLPNPWFHGIDAFDGSTLDGIQFVNLPTGTATVEIYNLAGELIASVEKSDPLASTVTWDVRTSFGLPPASGLYIYRAVVPGVGVKVGKLAIFVEEERLSDF